MLVVGVGGSVALEGVPASVARVDAVELEPEVIEANRLVSSMRNVDPLADPRINIVINDARNALRLTRKSYDAIVSQPSHPWTAGASHLFTREFAADVKSHLNEGGVFLQWMNGEFVDEPLLRTLAATLLAEFQYVRLYRPTARVLMFLASDAPLDVELALARTGRPIVDYVMHFSRLGVISVEDLLASMAMDEQGMLSFARGAEGNGLAAAIPDFPRQFEVYGLMFELTGQGDQGPESFANALLANPSNLQARYASIRGYLDVLSRGEAPADIQQIAAGLSGPAAGAIRGLAYEAAADWASLAALDGELAESLVTDAWYPEVVRLRAAWRVNAAEDRERLAAEALALIEQVLIVESNENLHTMRATAAGTLGDANRLVESSQYLAEAINSYLTTFANEQYTISAEQLKQVRANLTVLGDNIAGDLDVVYSPTLGGWSCRFPGIGKVDSIRSLSRSTAGDCRGSTTR